MLPLLVLIGCSDYDLNKAKPNLQVSASHVDFGDVVIGAERTGTLRAANTGAGVLHFDEISVEGADFSLGTIPALELDPGDEMDLSISYAPAETGPDEGQLFLYSDDGDEPEKIVPLSGFGVEPDIDVDPETLWFGAVELGSEVTLSVDVNSRGLGDLRVTDIDFAATEASAFAITLPEGVTLPTTLVSGTGFSFDVTFAPTDDTAWEGSLLVTSNDPDEPAVEVRLLGNVESTGELAPTAEITSPDWGNYIFADQGATLLGVVTDDADDPSDLLALWYADGRLLGTSTPDDTGAVSFETTDLPLGDVTLRLAAIDTLGNVGEDEVDVVVWDAAEPVSYILSGGSSIFDYWSVDDDITIYLDGSPIFRDTNEEADTHPPVDFLAERGQTLSIEVIDYKYCDRVMDGLVLHWGTASRLALNETVCVSACEDHECYDPDFEGPWPETFVDESHIISIP